MAMRCAGSGMRWLVGIVACLSAAAALGGDAEGAAGREVTTPPATGERYATRLRVGDGAPDFTLPAADGKGEVTLSAYRGKRPVVLVFGSLTCPPFRERVVQLEKLSKAYEGRVEFVMVYVREAHPDSVVRVEEEGKEVLMKVEQTRDLEARSRNARVCRATLKLTFAAAVDREDNKVNAAYAGWPSRLVVVDEKGKVALDGGPGPRGFQPGEVGRWLEMNVGKAE